jgi:protoheme IX farnesyltransferase
MTKPVSIRAYYELTKPGIVYGNVLVAAAGFLYAAAGHPNWVLFLYTLVGLALVIASACVFNNYFDSDIDKKMLRTASRALAVGNISRHCALLFGAILGITGAALLLFLTTLPAFAAALLGFVVYVAVYTPLKHVTPQALWVGAIAGATPPVVGYAAVTGSIDSTACWFFVFLFLWQVPHFLGIAAYRYDEYAAANIPLLINRPTARGKKTGRVVFYISLVVLLVWCGALMLHR